ncbi:DUF4255 domain-containing protein [Nannocystis radixulma]|uniref:DUF4255 domain-containing protein n=1 Tax=Nannocystis radixulma TaxID=2995305 RepID=A0ABT5BGW1_9BACT|nr:DUF4255 domain-containing protein [Nannocystis radixulma]MDC0672865.1 DUF4255 domain-containing protein [Nannocystis radixulma]
MALEDLSHVTQTLLDLLKAKLDPVAISEQSPDQLPTTTRTTISVYLYHAREDAHYKNAVARDGTSKPMHTPLGLSLYYVVTAHDYEDDKPLPLVEQRLLGYALKIFHDYPIIDDNTKIGETFILHSDLRNKDNALQIIYRPVGPEESATFWNGDDQRLIRFSAFYEVRVVLMQPEAVPFIPGYVLSVGNYVLPTGVMHLASSHSVVRFTPPNGDTIALAASPARVAVEGSTPAPPAIPNNQLTLRGSRLGGGKLVLRSPFITSPDNQFVIDPEANPTWEIHVTSTQITARVRTTLQNPGGGAIMQLRPGIYGVSVQVSSEYELPGGSTKTLTTRTNEIAIAITPFVLTHAIVMGAAGTPLDILTAPGSLAGDIEVHVAGVPYTRTTEDPPGLKEFRVAGSTITIGFHFADTNYGSYPFRLIVRGAEAPPFWIEVPA